MCYGTWLHNLCLGHSARSDPRSLRRRNFRFREFLRRRLLVCCCVHQLPTRLQFPLTSLQGSLRNRGIMAPKTAKRILEQISDANWCREACAFYSDQHVSKDRILDQGGADFDEQVGISGEKDWYRAAYYAGKGHGYVDMHVRQNRTVFMKFKLPNILKGRKALFVDFGCGPMTSGIMLAEMLPISGNECHDNLIYVGIDSSKNMCKVATWVNEIEDNKKIFERFHILNTNSFEKELLDSIVQEHFQPEITILCLSYVLAPNTFRYGFTGATNLAKNWCEFIQQLEFSKKSHIIYMNPKFANAHRNWNYMMQEFENHTSRDWKYETSQQNVLQVDGLQGPVVTQMITGARRS